MATSNTPTSTATKQLSEAEFGALEFIASNGGEVLESRVEPTNKKDCFGNVIPGMTVFRRLEKAGLVFFTEEDSIEVAGLPDFTFTPSICLTEAGTLVHRQERDARKASSR